MLGRPKVELREINHPSRDNLAQRVGEVNREVQALEDEVFRLREREALLSGEVQTMQLKLSALTEDYNKAMERADYFQDENIRIRERLKIGAQIFVDTLKPIAGSVEEYAPKYKSNEPIMDKVLEDVAAYINGKDKSTNPSDKTENS